MAKVRKNKNMKKFNKKLVYIEWGDAISNTGWMSEKEAIEWADSSDWIVKNVGWILKENKDYILLASKFSEGSEEYGLLHKIPKTWIKVRKVIIN